MRRSRNDDDGLDRPSKKKKRPSADSYFDEAGDKDDQKDCKNDVKEFSKELNDERKDAKKANGEDSEYGKVQQVMTDAIKLHMNGSHLDFKVEDIYKLTREVLTQQQVRSAIKTMRVAGKIRAVSDTRPRRYAPTSKL